MVQGKCRSTIHGPRGGGIQVNSTTQVCGGMGQQVIPVRGGGEGGGG